MAHAFIIGDHKSVGDRAQQVVLFQGWECPTSHVVPLHRAASLPGRAGAGLIAVVLSPDPELALGVLDDLRRDGTMARLLAVGPGSPKLVLRALRAGATDYVDEADLETDLSATLSRAGSDDAGPARAGKVIAVLAPSGGSGSSTLAVNVATVLAQEHKEVALVDLKLEANDLAALMDLKPAYTLADLSLNVERVDRVMLERSLAKHPSGVNLLAPPRTYADIEHVTPEGVQKALTMARAMFPYVVVDVDRHFREVQVQALRQADVILMVLRLDFASLRNARRSLDHLRELGIPAERVRLVVNRYGQPGEVLTAAKAEEALGVKVAHYIPDDPKRVNRANNNGVPVVLEAPSSKVSRRVAELAVSVNGAHRTAKGAPEKSKH